MKLAVLLAASVSVLLLDKEKPDEEIRGNHRPKRSRRRHRPSGDSGDGRELDRPATVQPPTPEGTENGETQEENPPAAPSENGQEQGTIPEA